MANISFDKVYYKYNTMIVRLPHGTHLPDIENTGKVAGCTVEFTYRDGTQIKVADGVFASKVVVENTPVEGQGTTSMKYRRFNLRMKTDANTIFKYYDDGGSYLGEKYDLKKKGLIDNLKYKVNKITAKKNIASFPQSHKMGSCNIYNDLYHDIVTDTQWSERLAVHQRPFIGFQEQDGVYTYIGHYTSGADKGDKASFGYNVETAETSHQLQIEGPNHDPLATLFQFPWYADSATGMQGFKYIAVDATGEKVEGLHNVDLKAGNDEAWDVSIAGSHFDGTSWVENGTDVKADESYIQALLDEDWKPAYNLAFFTDQAIKYSSNPAASGKVEINGVTYQLYDSPAGGMRVWFWNGTNYQVIPYEVHDMTAYLGLSRTHYSEDRVRAARLAKFKSELSNFFNKKSALFHYCYCILIAAKDNFAKNSYPQLHHSLATGGRWEWKQDDLDSILHTDNNGNPTVKYNIEFDDLTPQGTWYFQGGNSAFWRSIHTAYSADEIPEMMNSIVKAMVARSSKKDGSVHERVFQFFDDYYFTNAQKYFPAKDYEGDFEWAYRQPWFDDRTKSYNNVLPLTQVVGDSLIGETQWLQRRILYILSKYELDGFTKQQDDSYGVLEFRPASDYDFNLVPALSFYPNINSGDSAVNFKPAVPRVEAKASAPVHVISSGGTTCYIKAMDYLEEIGDLCKLRLSMGSALSVSSKRLRKLKLGDSDPSEVTTNIESLALNCPALQELMLANSPINSDIDLTNSKRLKKVDISHTDVPSIIFAPGAQVDDLKYSDKCTNIILPSLFNLDRAHLTLPADEDKITGIYVKDTPVEPISLIEDIRNTAGSQLKYITSIWTEETDVTTADLTTIFNILNDAESKNYGHIDVDGDGNVSFYDDYPKFEGILHVNQVVSVIKQYIEDNTNITIHADSVIYPTPEQVGLTLTPTTIPAVAENALTDLDLTASVLDPQYSMYRWTVDKYAGKTIADIVTSKVSTTSEKGSLIIREPKELLIAENNDSATKTVYVRVASLANPETTKLCAYPITATGISNIQASSNKNSGLKIGDTFQITINDDPVSGTQYGTKPKSFIECISTGAALTKVTDTLWQGQITEPAEDATVVVVVTTKYPDSTGTYAQKDIVFSHVNAPEVPFSVTGGAGVADVSLYSWSEDTSEWKTMDPGTPCTKYMKVKAVLTSDQPGYVFVWSDDWVPATGDPENERIWEFVDGEYPDGWTGEVTALDMAIVLTYNVPADGTVKIHNGLSSNLNAATKAVLIDGVETAAAKSTSAYSTNLTAGVHTVRIQTKIDPTFYYLCRNLCKGCTALTSAVIPQWSTKNQVDLSFMFSYAFEGCTNLGSVIIPTTWNITANNLGNVFDSAFKNTTITSFAMSLWTCNSAPNFLNAFPTTLTTFTIKGSVPHDASGNVLKTQFDYDDAHSGKHQVLPNVTKVYLESAATATYGMVRWFPNADFYVGTGTDAKKLTAFELYNCTRTPNAIGDPRLRLDNVGATISINDVSEFIPDTGYDTICTQLGKPFQSHFLTFTADKNQYFVVEGVDSTFTEDYPITVTYTSASTKYCDIKPSISNKQAMGGILGKAVVNGNVVAGPYTALNALNKTPEQTDVLKLFTTSFSEQTNYDIQFSIFQQGTYKTIEFPKWDMSNVTSVGKPVVFYSSAVVTEKLTIPAWNLSNSIGTSVIQIRKSQVLSEGLFIPLVSPSVKPSRTWFNVQISSLHEDNANSYFGSKATVEDLSAPCFSTKDFINLSLTATIHDEATDKDYYGFYCNGFNATSTTPVSFVESGTSTDVQYTSTREGVFATDVFNTFGYSNASVSSGTFEYTPTKTSIVQIAGASKNATVLTDDSAKQSDNDCIYVKTLKQNEHILSDRSYSELNAWSILHIHCNYGYSSGHNNLFKDVDTLVSVRSSHAYAALPVSPYLGFAYDAARGAAGNRYFEKSIITSSKSDIVNAFHSCGIGTGYSEITFYDLVGHSSDFTLSGHSEVTGSADWYNSLPSEYMSVNSNAFKGTGITSFNCPRVTSLGTDVFKDCSALNAVTLGFDADPSNTGKVSGWEYSSKTANPDGTYTYIPPVKVVATTKYSASTAVGDKLLNAKTTVATVEWSADGTNWTDITSSVTIPYTATQAGEQYLRVTNTDAYANGQYNGCTTLIEADVPSNPSDQMFNGCTNLVNVEAGAWTSVGSSAFYKCSSLALTELPETITTLKDSAFRECTALAISSLPEGITTLPSYVFNSCPNITLTSLPSGLTTFGASAFRGCTNLALTSIPDGVTYINSNCFTDCKSIGLITLPANLTSIGKDTFSGCTNLNITALPSTLTSIDSSSFMNCKNLTLTSLPDGLTTINSSVFSGCTHLALTSLPSGITSIGTNAFKNCPNITFTSLPSGITTINKDTFNGCTNLALTSLPDGLTSIGESAFQGCTNLALTSLPDSLTTIDNNTFDTCTSLALTSLPDGVTSIGQSAFNACTNLALTSLPDGLTSIGQSAFQGCTNLALTSLPSGITSIGSNAFKTCTTLNTTMTSCTIMYNRGTIGSSGSLGDGWTYSLETDNGDGTYTYTK